MKKHLRLLMLLLLALSLNSLLLAQNFHFQEGFATNAPPTGWLMTNVSYSTNHNNGLYTGDYSIKLKPNESFAMMKALNTAAALQFYCKVRDTSMADDFHLMIEKSNNKVDWTEIAKDPCDMENDSVFQLVNIVVNDASPELYIRFHATAVGGTATLGLCYIDDVSVTKLDASPSDATLADFSYNGISVPGFIATTFTYSIEVPYSVDQAVIAGSPNNPNATVTITQPTNLRGYEADRTGTIKVTSVDGTVSNSYKIIFTVSDYIYRVGFSVTGDGVMPLPGWRGGYTYTSVTIPMGNHGTYPGDAALKFMRGQPDKIGYLNTAKYIKSDTLSFWLSVSDPDGVEQLLVQKKVNGGVSVPLGLITSADMTGEWKLFTYAVKENDSTEIILTPTLTAEGITRIWIDDLAMKGKKVSGLSVAENKNIIPVSVFPNPVNDILTVQLNGNQFNKLELSCSSGQKMKEQVISGQLVTTDISSFPTGVYILTLKGPNSVSTMRVIKE
jgi:hypothetical protein